MLTPEELDEIRKVIEPFADEADGGNWTPHYAADVKSSPTGVAGAAKAILAEVERLRNLVACPDCGAPDMYLASQHGCEKCDAFF